MKTTFLFAWVLLLVSLCGFAQTITGGGLATSCNAVTVTGACTSYSLSAPSGNLPGAFTWQTLTTGSPSGVSITLQGSIDGTNWSTLDTSTATAGELRSITGRPMRNLRCNLGTFSGGTAPTMTCQFTVTSSSAGGGSGSAISPTAPAFNVTSFGAACDGSTDDTTAIQAAFTKASTTSGATLVFPVGGCIVSSAISMTGTAVHVVGQGSSISGIGSKTAAADVLDMSSCGNCSIDKMLLYHTVVPSGSATNLSIAATVVQLRMNDVYIQDGILGINIAGGAANLYFNNVWIITSLGAMTTAINFGGQMNSSTMLNIIVISTNSKVITNGFVLASGVADLYGYHWETTSGVNNGIVFSGNVENVHIQRPILDICGLVCINITNSNSGVFGLPNNATFDDVFVNPTSSGTNGVVITNSKGIAFHGGFVYSPSGSSSAFVTVGTSSGLVVSGLMVYIVGSGASNAIAFQGTSNSVISGNTVIGNTNTQHGIRLLASSLNNTVTGNMASGTLADAYAFDNTSNSNNFSGNTCGNGATITTCVSDLATGTGRNWIDTGSCTMASGACTAQTLNSHTYAVAPLCTATWTGSGILAGVLKVASTTTTVTPSSSTGTDTAVVNWTCTGN